MPYLTPITKICQNCSQSYATKSGKSQTCSKKCKSSLWGKNNREHKAQTLAAWRNLNPDKAKANYDGRSKEKESLRKAIYYNLNKEEIIRKGIERAQKLYHSDIQFKLRKILRSRLLSALQGDLKGGSAIEALGCSIEELKIHLESKFKPQMSWNNHCLDGWHIDHIKPLSSFDLTNPEQVKIACSYRNLQPLWWWENLKKADN